MASGGAASWVETRVALALAVTASVVALALTTRNMMLHARHYNFPRTQKYIFRILFVVPVYAICSGIAIVAPIDVGVVALMVRDCYEAFVVYSFLTLILEHAGGDYNCIEQIKHLPPVPHPWPMCCLSHVRRDGDLLRLSKQATLQFVVVKPLMAIVILIVLTAGWYFLSPFQVTLLVVYNTSYSVALYGLLMFYKATRPLLTPFKPVQKFVAVKSVIFATYWQSVIVHFIPGLSSQQSLLWNDWLLCMELVPFALLLNSAFPWHDFITEQRDKPVLENVREMLSVRDVFQDAYHSFMPSYQDYVVARDDHDSNSNTTGSATGGTPGGTRVTGIVSGGGDDGKESRVFRMRTFLIGNLDRGNMSKPNPSSELEGSDGSTAPPHSRVNRMARDEDVGGLDEDWEQDVDVIELQRDFSGSRRSSSGRSAHGRRQTTESNSSNQTPSVTPTTIGNPC